MRKTAATLLLRNQNRSSIDWETISLFHVVIDVRNLPLMKAAVDAEAEFRREINAVVFDGSITPSEFLQFLSNVRFDFRGDIMYVDGETGEGFLSATARSDGRVLYHLRRTDVQFYFSTEYDIRVTGITPSPTLVA